MNFPGLSKPISLMRPGIQGLIQDAMSGRFDVIIAEALDRLSRDQEDIAGIYKRMEFAGVKVITLSEGEINNLHVGLKGTMNALFLKDLADKTRRDLRGRVEAGKSGGGNYYGYDVVKRTDSDGEGIKGERTINEQEADRSLNPDSNTTTRWLTMAGICSWEMEQDALPAYEEQLAVYETTLQASKIKREAWLEEVRTAEKLGNPPPQIPKTAQEPDRPIRPRIRVADSTPEALANILVQQPKGILMQRDELAGWIKSFDRYSKGGEKQFWLEAYGGRAYTVDRVKNDSKPIEIPHFSISVLGSTQPDPLEKLLLSGDDNGFSARFLYFWPEKLPAKRPQAHPAGPAAYICLKRLHDLSLEATEENNMVPLIRRLTEGATDVFEPWWFNHQNNEPEGRFGGWWGKVPGLALRLSLIFEYLEWSSLVGKDEPPHISEQAITNAITLTEEYLKPMARRAYGNVSLSQDEKYAAIVAKYIINNQPDRINARDTQRKLGKVAMPNIKNMGAACRLLIDAGWLYPDFNQEGDHKGREKIEYLVNPELLTPAQ